MAKFIDLEMRDIAGAATQFRQYITDKLGYDESIRVEIGLHGSGGGQLWLGGTDKFQDGVEYSRNVGRLSLMESFKLDADWDAVCAGVWARLDKAMKRDERELRFGLQQMGKIVESAPSFSSEVGRLFAERIKTARDEATNYMIEHHGWQAQPAE